MDAPRRLGARPLVVTLMGPSLAVVPPWLRHYPWSINTVTYFRLTVSLEACHHGDKRAFWPVLTTFWPVLTRENRAFPAAGPGCRPRPSGRCSATGCCAPSS